jgi:hypothetical protein
MAENKLGKPDLKISGLQVWIHGREFPESTDFWDGNWLNVTAHCGKGESNIRVTGPLIHVPELAQFKADLEIFSIALQGKVELQTMEPNLKVELVQATTRRDESLNYEIEMRVNITPNQIFETHEFIFGIDKNQVTSCIFQLQEILKKYQIKEKS